jgi:hypothetical protein
VKARSCASRKDNPLHEKSSDKIFKSSGRGGPKTLTAASLFDHGDRIVHGLQGLVE